MQGISELAERVAAALAGVRVELARVTRLVSVRLHVHRANEWFQERVAVELVPDNYHDVMTATLQVGAWGEACAPPLTSSSMCKKRGEGDMGKE